MIEELVSTESGSLLSIVWDGRAYGPMQATQVILLSLMGMERKLRDLEVKTALALGNCPRSPTRGHVWHGGDEGCRYCGISLPPELPI